MRCKALVRVAMCCVVVIGATAVASAAVKLPALFADNMVLQRGQAVPVWGWADKGEEVTVTVAGQTLTTKADDDGRWKVTLDKLEVGQPLEMTVKGSSGNAVTLKNVAVGDVWLCAGQSNMEMGVTMCNDAAKEVAAANYPKIRLFMVTRAMTEQPATDVKGTWKPCSSESIAAGGWGGFSATAYFFGRQLYKDLNVPIGLIDSSWGGTPAEFWTSRETLEANPVLKPLAKGEASRLYNGMIAPLIPYAIRGAIWYQGESNAMRAHQYQTLFPAMIANWRADWGQGDFPFGYVQIAPFNYRGAWKIDPACCPELWEAQLLTLNAVPNTGMAVTSDISDLNDIHPKNKQDVGRRLALWALAKVYGRDIVYSGPIYKSTAVEDNKIRLQFDHQGGGLTTRDGKPLTDFTIAGEDQKFVPAVATIDGGSVVVHSDQVAKPVAVRFAWRETSTPNLANKEGLPASSFRTDRWKGVTEGK